MAITSAGYYGAVNDVQWAQLFEPLPYWFRPTSYVPSIVAGQRRISLTDGVAFGGGIRDASTAATPVDLPAPSSGGVFYLVVLRHTWNPNVGGTTTITALTGSSTDGTPPSTPPAAMPADLKTAPGTQYDIPVAWVHVRAADTALTLFDARMLVTSAGVAAAASPSALRTLAAITPVTTGLRLSCASNGVIYRYDGSAWVAQTDLDTLTAQVVWAPSYGGDSGATIGNDGGSDGYALRVGKVTKFFGRIVFGSSAITGGATIGPVQMFGDMDVRFSQGAGHFLAASGSVVPVVLIPQSPIYFGVFVVRDGGISPLNSLGNPAQGSQLRFHIDGVLV